MADEGNEDLQVLAVEDFENVTGKGLKANVSIDGVNSSVLAGNLKLMESEGVEVSEEVLNKFNDFVSDAKTTIVVAVDGEIKGIITLMDKIKDSSKPAIDHLHKMGIETYMLTGDNEKTASAVANAVGIDNIMANVLPNDKLDNVQELQKE